MGGLVEDGPSGDEPVGNKPDEEFMADTDEPMSELPMKPAAEEDSLMGLSPAAKMAIEMKKKKRRFV
jgi:hypothetical protein